MSWLEAAKRGKDVGGEDVVPNINIHPRKKPGDLVIIVRPFASIGLKDGEYKKVWKFNDDGSLKEICVKTNCYH